MITVPTDDELIDALLVGILALVSGESGEEMAEIESKMGVILASKLTFIYAITDEITDRRTPDIAPSRLVDVMQYIATKVKEYK